MDKDVLKTASKVLARKSISDKRKSDEWNFAAFLLENIWVKEAGSVKHYSFNGYEPMLQIVNNMHIHREAWFLKGTQIGFSTMFIGWNLYLPDRRGLDCGYGLPDKVMIKPFMKTRFTKEQIENSPALAAAYETHETELYYDCGSHYLYFLGVNVLSETMSRPMEQLSLDEVTIIEKDAIELIEERLDASSFGQLNGFAREMYPGGPADAGFQSGTQFVYIFRCPHCRHEQNLEELFYKSSLNGDRHPGCVAQINGLWAMVCEKCAKPYSRAGTGAWVAKHPDREVVSYRLPQLLFESKPLDRLMSKWLRSATRKSKRAKLHSSMLAIPDAGDLQRISIDTLRQLKRDYPMQARCEFTVGGMDMGDLCYAVFGTFAGDGTLRTIWWEVIDSDHVVERVSQRIIDLNTMCFVLDGMPLTTEARRIAYAFPDIVYLNYYRGTEMKEDEREHLGNEYKIITQDREDALDSYCDLFNPTRADIQFPARVIDTNGAEVAFEDSEFAFQHVRGSQKDEVEDNRLGKKIFKFKKHIPNHFFHAGNYMATAAAMLAREEAKFSGVAPIFGGFMRA